MKLLDNLALWWLRKRGKDELSAALRVHAQIKYELKTMRALLRSVGVL